MAVTTCTIVYLGAEVGAQAAAETAAGRARLVHVPATPEAVRPAMREADAVLDASMKVRITDDMIAAAERLRIISCATTGSDHIERNEADRRGIPVRTLMEDKALIQNLTPAAELSWALLLACARKIPEAVSHVRLGRWDRERFPGLMLNGKRLGIIGCGRIGTWMSRYAAAFGMDVVGYDPVLAVFPPGIRPLPLDELLEVSDVITIHVPLNPMTAGMLGAERFKRVKPGAILINTSRGAVVDEAALLKSLEEGRLGAAGLDVLVDEPQIERSPLLAYAQTHDNLLITPHCGGFSHDAVRIVCRRAAEKILDHLRP
jgi:D-3-phosphoglycerate dehydrogenase